ncbi:hypothetical protein AB6A40_000498 [Gnathostoma spinigerum]|uniref:SNARE-complex protein Syntaxin-18 N-terminal domain-containing protein n=1 Tax=Gnathostoma spinigerum TaxID=75299 RepID=A0ABD6E8V2_9BILA
MPVDNTALFRARAKMLRVRQNSSIHQTKMESDRYDRGDLPKAETSSPNFSKYSSDALEIKKNITDLRDTVLAKRTDYMSAVGHHTELAVITVPTRMTDHERDEMDRITEMVIRQCTMSINNLRKQAQLDSSLRSDDEEVFFERVAFLLGSYLKKTAKIVTDMRTVRLKKIADMSNFSRLEALVKVCEGRADDENSRFQKGSHQSNSDVEQEEKLHSLLDKTESTVRHRKNNKVKLEDGISPSPGQENKNEIKYVSPILFEKQDEENTESINSLSEEELTQLMAENEKLFSKATQTHSDIAKIERQMNEIQKLQETFAEKVIDQERDIDRVNETAIHTVENVLEGNTLIREAIKNGASRRVILLFCIIVLSFTLLFLDWYNP